MGKVVYICNYKKHLPMTIEELVDKYEADRAFYLTDRYNETLLRSDFLDPLFELLGWDIKNTAGRPTHEREVILEEPLKAGAGENAKKPDYTFRLFGERKFFLEAKKPCVHIDKADAPALQTRRYGYTANLKISVLSNFEYLLIYDTSVKVEEGDGRAKALLRQYHYTDYAEKFQELQSLIGREAVYSGRFDEEWKDIETLQNPWSVDNQFLKQINEWRLMLGNDLLAAYPSLDMETLNDEVQSYINKILFLRVCEDRNIETYKELLDIANRDVFHALTEKFREADRRYDSGLFDQDLSEQVLGNASSSFWAIIRQLYYPESPYSFSVFSSDILGRIYEIFISKKLSKSDGTLRIENKPDNADRDIVTTPTYIIREILRQTVTEACRGKSADEILEMTFADIACGSGAFLLETFQLLNDTLIDYYLVHDKSKLVQTGTSSYALKYAEKKRLLTQCIYGVDKDYNAVEATKFGLLLKLLENENQDSLREQSPILPSLDGNISYGNSLLGFNDVDAEEAGSINPYDFKMKFDVIVGNPPYMTTEGMKKSTPMELPLYKKKYRSAYKQFDKYVVFIERALSLVKEGGWVGYIVPNKFMKVGACTKLRKLIADKRCLHALTSFGASQVFSDKSNYTCLLILKNSIHDTFRYSEVGSLAKWRIADKSTLSVDSKSIATTGAATWALMPDKQEELFHKIWSKSLPLGKVVGEENIFNGIQTSANSIFIFEPTAEDHSCYTFEKDGKEWQVEKEATKPYFRTPREGDGLSTYRTFRPNSRVIFPYTKVHGRLELIPLTEMQESHPHLYGYLMAYKDELVRRDIKPEPATEEEWYRYGRHQSLEACNLPRKIIVGVLSTGDKYAIDSHGTFISSGGTAGYCVVALPEGSPYSIYYLQAILNSKHVEWLSSLYGEVFRGGYIARGTKVLKQPPIREIDFRNPKESNLHDMIAERQQAMIALGDRIAKAKHKRNIITLSRQLETAKAEQADAIRRLYGLSEEEDSRIPLIKDLYAAD